MHRYQIPAETSDIPGSCERSQDYYYFFPHAGLCQQWARSFYLKMQTPLSGALKPVRLKHYTGALMQPLVCQGSVLHGPRLASNRAALSLERAM